MQVSKEMRAVMADFLFEQMQVNDRIVVLDADLAKANGTKKLFQTYPTRAFDLGIAEANMVSVAAGLSTCGFLPFAFSFCPFITRRVADQVAISVCYAKRNVKLIGTDPCIAAQLNGATHMSVEDVGVMRSIPHMVIFEASDCAQYAQALPAIMNYDGPVYIRQLRKDCPTQYFADDSYHFELFCADKMRNGSDVTIIATGIEVDQAMLAADLLRAEHISAEVIGVHTIKPLDTETILESVGKTRCAVVCENHNVLGGLGSAVAEVLACCDPVPLRFIGMQDTFSVVGKLPYLLKKFHMDAASICAAALDVLDTKQAVRRKWV